MNRYNNGKIYCIKSNKTDQIYIGSTCSPLSKRLYQHRRQKMPNQSLTNILNYSDHYIELIEECKCKNKMELDKRRGEIIRGSHKSRAEHSQCVCGDEYLKGTDEQHRETCERYSEY